MHVQKQSATHKQRVGVWNGLAMTLLIAVCLVSAWFIQSSAWVDDRALHRQIEDLCLEPHNWGQRGDKTHSELVVLGGLHHSARDLGHF